MHTLSLTLVLGTCCLTEAIFPESRAGKWQSKHELEAVCPSSHPVCLSEAEVETVRSSCTELKGEMQKVQVSYERLSPVIQGFRLEHLQTRLPC